MAEHPPLLFQTLIEFCADRGLEQTDHCGHDPALLDKIDLPLKNRLGVAVESDNEPPLHL